MKLAYLLRYYPTYSETFVYDEIGAVAELIGAPRVWALDPGPGAALDPELHAAVEHCEVVPRSHHPAMAAYAATRSRVILRGDRGLERRWRGWGGRRKDLDRALWLGSQLRRAEVDQLHVHFAAEVAEVAWVVLRTQGIPYSVTVHARDLFRPRPSLPEILAGARVVVAISRYNRERLESLPGAERWPPPVVIRVGVPEPDPAELAPPAGPGPAVRLLAVGRLVEKKGFDVLLEALAQMPAGTPRWELDVIGDGPEGRPLRRRAEQLGLSPAVRWWGAVPRARVRERYRRGVDLLVAPCRPASDGDMDGIPVALMEAMSRGVAVVSTRLSGIPELIQHGRSGLLVPPADVAALARALASLIAAPEARARLAAEGLRRVRERHRLEAQAGLLVQALQ